MSTLWKYSYYVYLVIAAILVFEGVIRLNKDPKIGSVFLAIAALVLVKFFMTRRLRKRIQDRNQKN